MLNIILENILWPMEAKDAYCPEAGIFKDISSQQECQQKCIEKIGCVGISYSYKDGVTSTCYACNDDMISTTDNLGFYRRPGIVDV